MKVEKLTEELREEEKQEGELPKKSIRAKEDKQLIWFFIVIGVVFLSFLGPYFYIQDSNNFEYAHIDWTIEDYKDLRVYHGRFKSITNQNVNFNTFLRNDPRENEVETVGSFTDYKVGAIISMSPEVDKCRGELSRVMLDLGSFLKQGIGIRQLDVGSTNKSVAENLNRQYTTCESVKDRTVVIVELGEPKVVQDDENKECYTIYASDCQDIAGVEKFIVKTVDDFGYLTDEAIANQKE